VLSTIGVQSECFEPFFALDFADTNTLYLRCFAFPDDLDGLSGGLRGREIIDTLCEEFDYGMLWEEWGIISDLVVSIFL
jgi:hypothetical protein